MTGDRSTGVVGMAVWARQLVAAVVGMGLGACVAGQTGESPGDGTVDPKAEWGQEREDLRYPDGPPRPAVVPPDNLSGILAPTDGSHMREGDRLYALADQELRIFDLAEPAEPRLLGRTRVAGGSRAAMYVRGATVYVIDRRQFLAPPGSDQPVAEATGVEVLNTANPAAIELVRDERLPGLLRGVVERQDSLVLALREDGDCWGCDSAQGDHLRIASYRISETGEWSLLWERREPGALTVVPSPGGANGSSDVGDLLFTLETGSDAGQRVRRLGVYAIPAGDGPLDRLAEAQAPDLTAGGTWQVSAEAGWLRMVDPAAERIYSFGLDAEGRLVQLSNVRLAVPERARLRAVRFDGSRAFAVLREPGRGITPMLLLDLSDPTTPVQVGELPVPGGAVHLWPHGERLYTLELHADAAPSEGLQVAAYDIADLSSARELDRVSFEPDWERDDLADALLFNRLAMGWVVEPATGLMVASYDLRGPHDLPACGPAAHGAQLVTFAGDELTVRGELHELSARMQLTSEGDAWYGLSATGLTSFDLADPDAPRLSARAFAGPLMGDDWQVAGDWLAGIETDEDTGMTWLGLSRQGSAGPPDWTTSLSGLPADWLACTAAPDTLDRQFRVHSDGGETLYAFRQGFRRGGGQGLRIFIIDASRDTPSLVGHLDLESDEGSAFVSADVVGASLVIGNVRGDQGAARYEFAVYDLGDPRSPKFAKRLTLPPAAWSFEAPPTLPIGDSLLVQFDVPVPAGGASAQVVKLDLSVASDASAGTPITVPGRLLYASDDLTRVVVTARNDRPVAASRDGGCYPPGRWETSLAGEQECLSEAVSVLVLSLAGGEVSVLSSRDLGDEQGRVASVVASGNRVFARRQAHGTDVGTLFEPTLQVLEISNAGQLMPAGAVRLPPIGLGYRDMIARGSWAYLKGWDNELVVVNASDASGATVEVHPCEAFNASTERAHCLTATGIVQL